MNFLRATTLVLRKEMRIELRSKEILISTTLFALLVVILASLGFYLDPLSAPEIAPGVLWIAITFAGVMALGRSWDRERELAVIRGLLLAPIPRSAIYAGKALATYIWMILIEAILVVLVALFFHIDIADHVAELALLLSLGTIGFVAAGTLFSALAVRTNARDLRLAIVIFPLVAPNLLTGVVATRELFDGAPFAYVLSASQILLAFDLVFVVAGLVLFEALISD